MRLVLDGRTIRDHFPGIGRYTYNLALALAELAPTMALSVLYDPRQPNTRYDLAQLAAAPQVQLVPVAAANFSAAEQWRVPAALRRLGAEVYHSPYYGMPYRPSVPTVLTLYDLIPLRRPHEYRPLARLAFALTVRLAVAAAQHVLVISQASADDARRLLNVPTRKMTVTPLAADPAFAPQPAAAVAAVRARLGLPPAYALYVGSNKPHKNLPRLAETYARLPEAEAVPLVVAGHWDERYPEARSLAAAAGAQARVRFVGPVAAGDLPALYSGAELMVFASLAEGFGLPVLEAMACGTAVVCSDIPVLREVAGDAALCFDPAEAASMADALRRALADPALRRDLAQRGLARAASFSWRRVAETTLAVYEHAARGRRAVTR